jgi:uncharacterized protein YjiS (DUF1127 family)
MPTRSPAPDLSATVSWPLEFVKRPAAALGRRLGALSRHGQNCGDLASLDPHVLADIGLQRSLAHPSCLVPAPED